MRDSRDAFGERGEEVAAAHLSRMGLRVVERRARTRFGEIDLVCLDGAEVVFVEVKTRRGRAYGYPEAAVTYAKRQHLRAAARAYLADHGRSGSVHRIDVVAVTVAGGETEVFHVPYAVGEAG